MNDALANAHFLRPAWLLALPLAWGLLWRLQRATPASAWARLCDAELLAALRPDATERRRLWRWLPGLGISLAILALAGPSWERVPLPVYNAPAHRVLLMDLSAEMDAADLKPSRLLRAKIAARQLLDSQTEGDTALAVFGTEAFAVVPLSSDRGTVSHLLDSLDTSLMPADGAGRIDRGIAQAVELLERAAARRAEIVLLTASQPDAASRDAAQAALARGYRLSVIALGTRAGAPIPAPGGGWRKDADGAIRLARLPVDDLARLAGDGGGRFARAGAQALDWPLDGDGLLAGQDRLQESLRWRDAGPWLLLPLLLLAAAAFRPGLLPVMLLLMLPLGPAQADWWRNADQSAKQTLDAGDAAAAAARFEDPDWQATALYRAGDYARAAERWAELDGVRARYNQANALARAGELDAALAALDEVLAMEPTHADARHNRELLEALREQQQQQQQQQQEGQPDSGEEKGQEQGSGGEPGEPPPSGQDGEDSAAAQPGEDSPSDSPGDQQPATPPPPAGAGEPGDATGEEQEQMMSEAQAGEDEQSIAVQQWLKRIPDDPGQLLREKFRREQARREAGRR